MSVKDAVGTDLDQATRVTTEWIPRSEDEVGPGGVGVWPDGYGKGRARAPHGIQPREGDCCPGPAADWLKCHAHFGELGEVDAVSRSAAEGRDLGMKGASGWVGGPGVRFGAKGIVRGWIKGPARLRWAMARVILGSRSAEKGA